MYIDDAHPSFCEYQQTLRGQSSKTIAGHRNAMSNFRKCYPDIVHLSDVTCAMAEEFFSRGVATRGWSPATFHTYHKRLNIFFGWCVERGITKDNPFAHIAKPKLGKRIPKGLSKADAERLIEAPAVLYRAKPFIALRNQAIMSLFMHTGLRKGELLNLKTRDIDLGTGMLLVQAGKGDKDRTIPLSRSAINVLNRYYQARLEAGYLCPYFFFDPIRDVPLTDTVLRRIKQRLTQGTGISFHWHQLRHTFATLMIEGGCDIYALSRMMGHADISTTTIYLSASVSHLRSQMDKHPLNWSAPSPAWARPQAAGTNSIAPIW